MSATIIDGKAIAAGVRSEVAGMITLVPGGVGPMTTAMLLLNTVTAAEALAGLR